MSLISHHTVGNDAPWSSSEPSMGRRCPSILGYHKGNRKWYRKINRKFIYFGKTCEKSPESFQVAWRAYQAWLAENKNPIDIEQLGGRYQILHALVSIGARAVQLVVRT